MKRMSHACWFARIFCGRVIICKIMNIFTVYIYIDIDIDIRYVYIYIYTNNTN